MLVSTMLNTNNQTYSYLRIGCILNGRVKSWYCAVALLTFRIISVLSDPFVLLFDVLLLGHTI